MTVTVRCGATSLTWDERGLSGDPYAVGLAHRLVDRHADVAVTPTGPFVPASLDPADPAFRYTLLQAIDDATVGVGGAFEVEGDWPGSNYPPPPSNPGVVY